jgi:hypothetical protein
MAKVRHFLHVYISRECREELHPVMQVTLMHSGTNVDLAVSARKKVWCLVRGSHRDDVDGTGPYGQSRLKKGDVLLLRGAMSIVLSATFTALLAENGFGAAICDPRLGSTTEDAYIVVNCPNKQYSVGDVIKFPKRKQSDWCEQARRVD